jgi:hypothetical protein
MLASTLICVMVLPFGCSRKTPPSKTYQREYHVDWEHGFQEGLGEVEVGGKWGFINSSGQIVIKPQFNHVFRGFTDGIAMVRSGAIVGTAKAGEFGRLAGEVRFIDKEGRTVWKYPAPAKPFSEGLAAVCVGGRWGMLSEVFGAEAKWGFINTKGEMVIPPKYKYIRFSFSEGLAVFGDPNSINEGYINRKGEVVVEPQYILAFEFSEGLAAVCKEEGWGFIDKNGRVVIPLKYESARSFSEGLAPVSIKDKKNEKWGFINKNGDVIIPLQYDYAVGFRERLAVVEKDDKWGYINASGDLVIPFRFDDAEAFSEGLAQVKIGNKWGYIDKKGDFVIEPKFYFTSPFTEGFAKVVVSDKLGYIDKQGKYIWEPTR